MGIEIVVWELIVHPILLAFFSRLSKEPKAILKKASIAKYKNKYLEKVNQEMILKYGSETFYTKLANCLFGGSMIVQIIDRTYKRNVFDTKLDDEFIDDILNHENWGTYDQVEVRHIMRHLIQTSFEIFNSPTSDTERILSNITILGTDRVIEEVRKDNRALESKIDKLESKLEIFNPLDNIPKPVINIIHDKRYNLIAYSQNDRSHFMIEFHVEYIDEMRKFKNMEEYQNYLNFSGVERTFNVARIIVLTSENEIVWQYSTKKSDFPIIKLVPILVDTVPIFPPVDLESSDQCFLEFTPPQKVIIVDIENDVGDKIIPNLNLKISRKMLEKSKYAVTLTDVSSFSKLRVDLSFILYGGKILNTCISSKVMLDTDVHSRLALYVFIDKIMNANNVIFREIKSNNIIFKASGVEYSESKENLRSTINFYKKIVFIQDQLKITFEIPEKIYRDDEKIVNQLFDILKSGYTIDENIGFNLKDIEYKTTDFDALLENKTEILFQCNIIYMHLFNKKIEFNRDFFYIVPKALISVKENGNYSLVPQAKVIMVYEPVYKKFEINDVIDKDKKELGL